MGYEQGSRSVDQIEGLSLLPNMVGDTGRYTELRPSNWPSVWCGHIVANQFHLCSLASAFSVRFFPKLVGGARTWLLPSLGASHIPYVDILAVSSIWDRQARLNHATHRLPIVLRRDSCGPIAQSSMSGPDCQDLPEDGRIRRIARQRAGADDTFLATALGREDQNGQSDDQVP